MVTVDCYDLFIFFVAASAAAGVVAVAVAVVVVVVVVVNSPNSLPAPSPNKIGTWTRVPWESHASISQPQPLLALQQFIIQQTIGVIICHISKGVIICGVIIGGYNGLSFWFIIQQ